MQYLVIASRQRISRPLVSFCLGATLLAAVSGCDLLREDEAFREGVIVAGTDCAVPFSAYAIVPNQYLHSNLASVERPRSSASPLRRGTPTASTSSTSTSTSPGSA